MKKRDRRQRDGFLTPALAVVLSLAVAALPAAAEVPPTADTSQSGTQSDAIDPDKVSIKDFERVCGKVLVAPKATPTPGAGPGDVEIKRGHCKTAKSAIKAADSASLLWKVWAGVAGVCTTACVASLVGAFNAQYVCTGVNVGAGVTDAVITHEFAAALTALGASGASFLVNSSTKSDEPAKEATKTADAGGKAKAGLKDAAPEKKVDKDIGSCITAATAATSTYMKHSTMKSSRRAARDALRAAAELADPADQAAFLAGQQLGPGGSLSNDSGAQAPSSGGTSGQSGNPAGNQLSVLEEEDPCSSEAQPSPGVAIACAQASDSNLPGFVGSPRFNDDFKKGTGIGLGDLFEQAKDPTHGLGMSMAPQLGPAAAPKLAEALQNLQANLPVNVADATYSGGGGGFAGGGGEPDMAAMMAGVMQQFLPKDGKGAGKEQPGVAAVAFAAQTRGPASLAEDPKLSIFDRVTFRYLHVRARVGAAPGTRGGKQP